MISTIVDQLNLSTAPIQVNGELRIGAQLPTKDGRKISNAYIIDALFTKDNEYIFTILTEVGNVLELSIDQLDELFYPPEFVYDMPEVRQRFMVQQPKEWPKEWCCSFASATRGWNHDFNCENWTGGL